MSDALPMAMLERRRIEAAMLKHVYDVLKVSHGVEAAQRAVAEAAQPAVDEAVRRSAMEQGRQMAAAAGPERNLDTFIDGHEPWLRGGALTIEVKERSATRYRYDVTRCRYAEMYRDMGLGEIG